MFGSILGATYLAPLRHFFSDDTRPDFVPWNHGESGKFKSELAALSQGHFGPFSRQSLPLNFSSTPNAIERTLFSAKDFLVVVDDYHPPADQREANSMSQVASRLTRSAGNASGRGRLRSDLTPRSDFYPRSLPMVTGERLPEGYSTLARIFPIEIKAGDIRPDLLTEAQNARDLFPKAMSAFLQWLALRCADIRTTLTKRFLELRTRARDIGRHGREPGQVAHLYCALELWMTFCVEIGAIDAKERDAWLKRVWDALCEQARLAAREMQQETPTKRFLALLVDGFASRQIYMEDRAGKAPHNPDMWGWEWKSDALGSENRHLPSARLVGILDDDWLYLFPETAYSYAVEASRRAARQFPVERRSLEARLRDEGLTEPGPDNRSTVVIKVKGRSQRVIKLRRTALEGYCTVFEPVTAVTTVTPANGQRKA